MGTKIEWTNETWNPVTGCTKVSEGCRNCYAERMSKRLAGRFGYPEAPNSFDVTLHPDRLEDPIHWKKPRMVFVCSMGDLFHPDVPDEFIARVWGEMRGAREHTFQILTKRPERALSFLKQCKSWEGWITHNGDPVERAYDGTGIIVGDEENWPLPNVWIGVSVEDQAAADERILVLLDTPAAVRFVSIEPILGPVYLWRNTSGNMGDLEWDGRQTFIEGLDWVIVGGESGPGARPPVTYWIRNIRDQCVAADVSFFFKQWGGPNKKGWVIDGKVYSGRELDGEIWDQFPVLFF